MTQQWNSSNDEDVTMPLGAGGGEQEFSVESEPKAKMNGPTVVLFAAFAAALVVIYLVGMQNKPRAASAEQLAHDQQVNSAIQELMEKNGKAGEFHGLFQDTDKLVKMFYSYLGSEREETPALPHDPFASDEVKAVVAGDEPVVVPTNTIEAEKLRKVAETFTSLKLQSVMVGRTSVAMINNRMVTVGAHIGELTVAAIEPSRVLMNYGKSRFELKLNRPDADPQ